MGRKKTDLMHFVELAFNCKETVYLKTCPEQLPRIITGILIRPSGTLYELAQGDVITYHQDFEISREENLDIALQPLDEDDDPFDA